MASDFLLEIGTEEIPASYIEPALEAMAAMLRKILDDRRIAHGTIQTMATPRRLVWRISAVADKQESQTVEITGPPKQVAYDDEGKPTKAALGFAKAQGVSLDELQVKKTDRGEYLMVRRHQPGMATRELLSQVLPDCIQHIPFPKSMRWGTLKVHFARPVHWIVALLGKEVVPFTFGNVASGSTSYGHRFMSPESFEVDDIDAYPAMLQERFVIVDIADRKERIRHAISACAESKGGKILEDEVLLDEVTQLVEYPTAVIGSFDQHYLELPREVLITAMRSHQRYFAVVDDRGELMPHFVTVNNTLTRDPEVVARGNERVLRARLEDARFYYLEDQKVPLEDRVEELKEVVFHSQLGTSYEKMARFKSLAEYMAEQVAAEEKDIISRAAFLCKADLVTGTVGEFPELQGVMGRAYARLSGENEAVAQAIYEHYLPTHAGGELPQGLPGALISIADKLDTIVGCFGIGQIPSGTADPFALRRQALGIIRIILDKNLPLKLADLIEQALMGLESKITEPAEETRQGVMEFFKVRFQNFLIGQGFSTDVVEAVLAYHLDPFVNTAAKIRTLTSFKARTEFEPLVATAKRVVNILKEEVQAEVEPELLVSQAEKELVEHLEKAEKEFADHIAAQDYDAALAKLAELKPPIDRFFDDVMVLDKDEKLRRNRLALLTRIAGLYRELADFSRIVV
ncbi:MAG: glycine--tRNA ligase subunit beta [Deltaproteobacteria bacterium]|nr:glycine--tRNA ligase subunit beta [Deltaproteobacteria bacterium]MBW2070142.1 glycine--tRNA ligase subunit beta [Deltaproteobacteria bacterium]